MLTFLPLPDIIDVHFFGDGGSGGRRRRCLGDVDGGGGGDCCYMLTGKHPHASIFYPFQYCSMYGLLY